MLSLEIYVALIISDFFRQQVHLKEPDKPVFQSLLEYFQNNCNIQFEGLKFFCNKTKSGFDVNLISKNFTLKMEYVKFVKT